MMMGHGVSVLLITSAIGYWVLTQAHKEKGNLRKLGQILGLLIIAASVAGAACKIACAVQACNASGGYGAGKMACPFTGRSAPAQPAK